VYLWIYEKTNIFKSTINHVAGLQQELFGIKDISQSWKGKIAEHNVGIIRFRQIPLPFLQEEHILYTILKRVTKASKV
jgi:hypothetical protein